MKKFHRNLLDGMMGPKDERERLEAYERLALGAAYIFWIAILLNFVGMLADWAPAKWSGSVLLLIFLLVHGWPKGKARDLSDDAIPNPREITPETARGILKRARWRSLAWAAAASVPIALFLKNKAPEVPNGAIAFFGALVFVAVGVAMYGSAVKKVKETLRELREDEEKD